MATHIRTDGRPYQEGIRIGRPVSAGRFRRWDADGCSRDSRAPQKAADDWGRKQTKILIYGPAILISHEAGFFDYFVHSRRKRRGECHFIVHPRRFVRSSPHRPQR
jgi:hypothetical protein